MWQDINVKAIACTRALINAITNLNKKKENTGGLFYQPLRVEPNTKTLMEVMWAKSTPLQLNCGAYDDMINPYCDSYC